MGDCPYVFWTATAHEKIAGQKFPQMSLLGRHSISHFAKTMAETFKGLFKFDSLYE